MLVSDGTQLLVGHLFLEETEGSYPTPILFSKGKSKTSLSQGQGCNLVTLGRGTV